MWGGCCWCCCCCCYLFFSDAVLVSVLYSYSLSCLVHFVSWPSAFLHSMWALHCTARCYLFLAAYSGYLLWNRVLEPGVPSLHIALVAPPSYRRVARQAAAPPPQATAAPPGPPHSPLAALTQPPASRAFPSLALRTPTTRAASSRTAANSEVRGTGREMIYQQTTSSGSGVADWLLLIPRSVSDLNRRHGGSRKLQPATNNRRAQN